MAYWYQVADPWRANGTRRYLERDDPPPLNSETMPESGAVTLDAKDRQRNNRVQAWARFATGGDASGLDGFEQALLVRGPRVPAVPREVPPLHRLRGLRWEAHHFYLIGPDVKLHSISNLNDYAEGGGALDRYDVLVALAAARSSWLNYVTLTDADKRSAKVVRQELGRLLARVSEGVSESVIDDLRRSDRKEEAAYTLEVLRAYFGDTELGRRANAATPSVSPDTQRELDNLAKLLR